VISRIIDAALYILPLDHGQRIKNEFIIQLTDLVLFVGQ